MATTSVSHRVAQSASPTVEQYVGQAVCPIQQIYEKMGFRVLEGWSDLEEEWESPNVLLLTGKTEMESECGAVLHAPVAIRVEFGNDYRLDISRQEPDGKLA